MWEQVVLNGALCIDHRQYLCVMPTDKLRNLRFGRILGRMRKIAVLVAPIASTSLIHDPFVACRSPCLRRHWSLLSPCQSILRKCHGRVQEVIRWHAIFNTVLRDHDEAPYLFDGPINGERFLTYVEHALARTLRPGDLVILDNLARIRERRCDRPSERPPPR